MTALLILDPGYDVTGWAVFTAPTRQVLTNYQAKDLYVASGAIRSACVEMENRLERLTSDLEFVIGQHAAAAVFIERPTFARTYDRHKYGRADLKDAGEVIHAALGPMHVTTGALWHTCRTAGLPVRFIAPLTNKKERRAEAVYAVLPELGPPGWTPRPSRLSNGRPRSNADQRDAVLLGFGVVTDARRQWATALLPDEVIR